MHPLNIVPFHQSDKLSVLICAGFSPEWALVRHLNRRTRIYNLLAWNLQRDHLVEFNEAWRAAASDQFDHRTQVIWLMNTEQQVHFARELGLRALFVNHNAFLDERLFSVANGTRPYRAIVNARAFRWKRIYLADEIANLAWLRADTYTDRADWQWDPWYRSYAYVNPEPIWDPTRVAEILGMAEMGLCLSGSTGPDPQGPLEGACYSSSEFLLCGLPVVSTPSEGGRDIWYDAHNSLISEPTPAGVRRACDEVFGRLKRGEIDRDEIRQRHIRLQDQFRDVFIESTRQLFFEAGVSLDAEAVFRSAFVHKMLDYNVDAAAVISRLKVHESRAAIDG